MYHLSVKPISRSVGRSAVAAAAYRSGTSLSDERTGELHDYTRKRDVVHSEILLPPGAPAWGCERSTLWNAAEAAEKRKDARVARDYEVALPKELSREEGIALVRDFSQGLVERYGVAVDFNVHRDDPRHWDGSEKGYLGYHAHILATTRKLGIGGFGDKAEPELSDAKRKSLGLGDGASEVAQVRQRWQVCANRHLEQADQAQRIDCRSLKDQGIDREPTIHLGPYATELERRGVRSELGDVNRRIELAWQQGIEDRQAAAELAPQLIDTETSLARALQLRQQMSGVASRLASGADSFVQRFEAQQQARQKQQALERQAAEEEWAKVERAAQAQAQAKLQIDRRAGIGPDPEEQARRDRERHRDGPSRGR